MKKEEYVVNNIAQFLEIIEKNNISEYVYRGQNEPYFSICANGFRSYSGSWNADKIYDLNYIYKAFKNRVIGQLSISEQKDFLAFCQHHGIPTNLIDISYSPLIALFFACDGKDEIKFSLTELVGDYSVQNLAEDESLQKMLIHNFINESKKPYYSPFAQTYMIKKERLVDISDLVIKIQGESLFEKLLVDSNLIHNLLEHIEKKFASIGEGISNRWLENLSYEYVKIVGKNKLIEKIQELVKQKQDSLCFQSDGFCDTVSQYEYGSILLEKYKEAGRISTDCIYIFLLMEMLNDLKNNPRNCSVNLDIYFTYQPPEFFKRMSNQQSLFIYQPYLFTSEEIYNYNVLNLQNINPDILIEIDDYSNVLNNLSILGINSGTIYGDMDNIAKSILRTSGKLLEKNKE
ncbi:MAG: FRG domain-containing protein [Culicoidibacterales bacterium]